CEAGFTLLAVPVLDRIGAWGVSVHSVWLGAAMFGVLAVASDGVGAVHELTGVDWLAIAYLAVLVTAVAFVLWYSAVSTLGAGRASGSATMRYSGVAHARVSRDMDGIA